MKIINLFKIVLPVLLSFSITITSCKKAEDVPTIVAINTITDKLVEDSANYRLLTQAIKKAGLDFKFKTTGAYTLFAPDDTAFLNAGFTASLIKDSISAAALSNIILYHTISPKVLSTNITVDSLKRIICLNGDSIYLYKSLADAVFVNGMPIIKVDKEADNGVIHKLRTVLKQPTKNIVDSAIGAGLDSLLVAITRVNATANASGGDTTFTATLKSKSLTVFAPSNAAFRALLTALSFTRISQIPVMQLKEILKYHVVEGRVFSPQLKNGQQPMLSGATIKTTIDISASTPTIKGTNIGNLIVTGTANNTCNIIATNIMCRNGVVHLIDRVLLP
jgi:uncharacterized surface protein with fasciclin (FAS1) repeats